MTDDDVINWYSIYSKDLTQTQLGILGDILTAKSIDVKVTADTELLSTLDYHNPLSKYVVDDPVSIIYSYMVNNHREEITIEALARQVGMNPTSLCRYYKQRTGKTIFNTLAEIRVGCACKLLAETDLTV